MIMIEEDWGVSGEYHPEESNDERKEESWYDSFLRWLRDVL